MIDCWQRLDLAPTTDERAIRRAYAKILKTIDQDIEPERFITLREAMQQALDQARYADWDEPDDEDWASTTVNEVNEADANEQSKTDAEPLIIHVAQGHAVESAPEIAEPIASPADFASAWTTEHTVERKKIKLNQSSSAVPIWHDWQPNQTARRVLERDMALLREAWWAGQYDDARYIALADILKRLVDQPLALQMDIQEQLVELLAWSPEQAETERFIQLLVEKLGLQRDAVGLDAPSMQLQQRWTVLESRASFWRNMPTGYHKDLRCLADGSRFYWRSMWRLSGAKDPRILGLKNINWHGVPYRDPDRLGNLALQLLLRIRAYVAYLPTMCLVFLIAWLCLSPISEDGISVLAVPAIFFSLIWHWLVQAPFSAWLVTRDNPKRYRIGLLLIWLTSALLTCLFLSLLPPLGILLLVCGWSALSALWLGDAFERLSASLPNEMLRVTRIQVDGWLLSCVSMALVFYGGMSLGQTIISMLPSESSLSLWLMGMFFSVPVIGLLVREEVLNQFRQLFEAKKELSQRTQRMLSAGLVFLVVLIGALGDMLKLQVAIALMLLGTFTLSLIIPSRWMAQLIKHGSYLSIAAFLLLINGYDSAIAWFALLPAIYWFLTLRADYRVYQASRSQ